MPPTGTETGGSLLQEAADEAGVAVTQAPDYGRWRGAVDRLREEGQAILAGRDALGPHLDNIPAARELVETTLSSLGKAIRKDDEELAEARREGLSAGPADPGALARLRFAPVTAPDIGGPTVAARTRRRRHAGATGVLAAAARPRLGWAPRGKREAGRDRSRDASIARTLEEPQGALGPAGGPCGEGGCPRHLHQWLRDAEEGDELHHP